MSHHHFPAACANSASTSILGGLVHFASGGNFFSAVTGGDCIQHGYNQLGLMQACKNREAKKDWMQLFACW